jgi:hypothetical protein
MPSADPGIAFNCPKCWRKLVYITSSGGNPPTIHIYECPVHGRWRLAPDAPGFRPEPRPVN